MFLRIGWFQYGGGCNIKFGQKFEIEEERIVREIKMKKLLDDYKKKVGLNVFFKVKVMCEMVSNKFCGLLLVLFIF